MSEPADHGPPAAPPPLPPLRDAYQEAEARASALIREATGADLVGHLVTRLQARPGVRLLTLGPSAGALALGLAALAPETEMQCVAVDAALAHQARQRAAEEGLRIEAVEADLDTLVLERAAFDVIFSHAALHQVVALEAVADQLRRALRRDGALVVVDVAMRPGYRMWPETREVAEAIWRTLPAKFRLNHTLYRAPLIDDVIWEPTPSPEDERRSRTDEILPIIDSRFVRQHFVPYFSLSRRFFDPTYGPNYDLDAPLDKALFDWIWQLDLHHLATGRLRPEVFFGIYRQA